MCGFFQGHYDINEPPWFSWEISPSPCTSQKDDRLLYWMTTHLAGRNALHLHVLKPVAEFLALQGRCFLLRPAVEPARRILANESRKFTWIGTGTHTKTLGLEERGGVTSGKRAFLSYCDACRLSSPHVFWTAGFRKRSNQ